MSATRANEGPKLDTVPRILIVEDDVPMARCLARIGDNFGNVTIKGTVTSAIAQLDSDDPPFSAAIVDLGLPDGSGLDVVSHIRANDSSVPTLILTGNCEHDVINSAFDLGAQYLNKPASRAQIERFLASAYRHPERLLHDALLRSGQLKLLRGAEKLIAERVEHLAKACKLTTSEADLVEACLRGVSRKEYVQAQALSVNTYKTRVRKTLRKIGAYSLSEVRDRLLRLPQTMSHPRGVYRRD